MKIQYIKIRKRTEYSYQLIELDHGIYHDYGTLDFKGVVNALLNIMNEARREFMDYHGDALFCFDRLSLNEYKDARHFMSIAISKHHEARDALTNLEHLEVDPTLLEWVENANTETNSFWLAKGGE